MKYCSKFCCGIWPFILLPLFLLLIVITISWRSIEQDVIKNAQQALPVHLQEWVLLEIHDRGRDILLSGEAPTKKDKAAALSAIEQAYGVRTVSWQGTIAPSPAELSIEKTKSSVILTGSSGNIIDDDLLSKLKVENYATSSEYKIVDRLNDLLNLALLFDDELKLSIKDDELTLYGTLDALGKSKSYEQAVRTVFTGRVLNQFKIELPKIAEEELVDTIECQDLFDRLTDSSTIQFESSKSKVLSESFSLLDQFTRLSLRCPAAYFEVIGHTDSSGNPEFNQKLSLDRAGKVVEHIVNSGVNAKRFKALGLGDSSPIANNATEEGRALNRRVEFKVYDLPTLENGNK